jgi:hypothetical protein
MFKDAQLEYNSIPLSTNFKLFKYFSATSLNYEEVWYAKTIEAMMPTKVQLSINCKRF